MIDDMQHDNHLPILFIIGLHRSGTSIVHEVIRDSPGVSGFQDTGVREDEGQHLQDIVATDRQLGGVGRFSFHPDCYLDENSLQVAIARRHLLCQWYQHWEPTAELFVEKSPVNIMRTRFLQAVFPNARFLIILRHPIANSMALTKWTPGRLTMTKAVRNWINCYQTLYVDSVHLHKKAWIHYETLVAEPAKVIESVVASLNLPSVPSVARIEPNHGSNYFKRWKDGEYYLFPPRDSRKNQIKALRNRCEVQFIEWRYERTIREFGYSFKTPTPISAL
jgi:hypothetical protein